MAGSTHIFPRILVTTANAAFGYNANGPAVTHHLIATANAAPTVAGNAAIANTANATDATPFRRNVLRWSVATAVATANAAIVIAANAAAAKPCHQNTLCNPVPTANDATSYTCTGVHAVPGEQSWHLVGLNIYSLIIKLRSNINLSVCRL